LLATCRWIEEHQQVLITAAAGTGKSFVACALAHHAGCDSAKSWPSASSTISASSYTARNARSGSRPASNAAMSVS
jgi:2-phosphoglycerate kinase